jgi:hypothetical protein
MRAMSHPEVLNAVKRDRPFNALPGKNGARKFFQ